ncbi:MAG: hypothetical protein JWP61_1823, partial [Friedmanniella sp.]|nr:hypothetical protein [Friedmanniella sp.]
MSDPDLTPQPELAPPTEPTPA